MLPISTHVVLATGMFHHGWGGGLWTMGLVMLAGWALIIGLAVAAAVYVARSGSDGGSSGERSGSRRARDLLDERYARGEIDTEEYRERLAELERQQD